MPAVASRAPDRGRTSRTRSAGDARPRHPFRTLHVFGWTAYGISTYLSILPELPSDQYAVVFAMKVIRTAIGFGFSVLLHRAYRALLERGSSYRGAALAALPACLVVGAVWLALYRIATGPLRPPALSLGGWTTAPRAPGVGALAHVVG